MGNYIRKNWQDIADTNDLDIKIWGLPALSGFSFLSKRDNLYKTLITQEMLSRGILAGNSIYVSTEHTKKIVDNYLFIGKRFRKKIEIIRITQNV